MTTLHTIDLEPVRHMLIALGRPSDGWPISEFIRYNTIIASIPTIFAKDPDLLTRCPSVDDSYETIAYYIGQLNALSAAASHHAGFVLTRHGDELDPVFPPYQAQYLEKLTIQTQKQILLYKSAAKDKNMVTNSEYYLTTPGPTVPAL